MIFYNPLLGAIQLLFISISLYPVKKMTKSIESNVTMIIENNAKMNQIKGDVFKAIEFIKLMRLEEQKVKEVKEKNKQIVKIWGKVATIDTLSGVWSIGFMAALFTGITFGLGALFCMSENKFLSLSIGSLVAIITYCGIYYSNMHQVLSTDINRKKHEAEYSKLFSYFNLKGEREENINKLDFNFINEILFNNLSFSYNQDSKVVLNNINLKIKKGEWTGIIGPSGSGKSTLFDLILKMYSSENSMLLIDNVDINDINSFYLRDKITKISQDIYLFPGTIKENMLLLSPNATDSDIDRALDFSCLKEYIYSLPQGINTEVGEAGKLMSGGEKQRLSIAMGILRGNNILLLDEVTSNLNSDLENRLCDNFYKLIKQGYTIISISHHLSFLKYSNVIYKIENGKLVKTGNYLDFEDERLR